MPVDVLSDAKYREIKDALQSAWFSSKGCMCETCQVDRRRDVAFHYIRTEIYPDYVGQYPARIFTVRGRPTKLIGMSVIYSMMELRNTNEAILQDHEEDLGDDWEPLQYCAHCGILHEKKDEQQHQGNSYCSSCWIEFSICHECDGMYESTYTVRADATKSIRVCQDCYREGNYQRCNTCGMSVKAEQMSKEPYRRDSRGEINYKYSCGTCHTNVQSCSMCGGTKPSSVMRNGDLFPICPQCDEMEAGMMDYSFKPLHLHFCRDAMEGKVSEKAFHMGWEIEAASLNQNANVDSLCHMIKEQIGRKNVYCVHDGTIETSTGYQGLEVCHMPFSWEFYKRVGRTEWPKLLMYMRSKGLKSNLNGCGLHVHTTKAAWGPFQVYKLLKFIYRNEEFIIKIAGREPNDYCRMSQSDFDEAILTAKYKKNRTSHHYSAINMNVGDNSGASSKTIEFRMFQGTLEPLLFLKNIEFVHACWSFTKRHTDMTEETFIRFIRENDHIYICLNEFLNLLKEENDL
jgi:hypothetical protein